ncbi:MAG: hypothetical protein R3C51_11285 [Parvularculaceae bacterium]
MSAPKANSYKPGHPWYYFLGGKTLRPKEILEAVRNASYHGYRSDIGEIEAQPEPKRSQGLRRIRAEILEELRRDLSAYRKYARQLHALRRSGRAGYDGQAICSDIHTAMSLKHNHLYNDFAHLIRIDDALSKQRDLFDF